MLAVLKYRRTLPLIVVLILGQLGIGQALAVTTLWNFLGIPQGVNKIRDATTNRRGNFPGLERKPPLKGLADPENLASKNPAIKKAAEIKQEEDLKKQKIKALKYLAKIGCGCYPGVKEALMAALDDCTEEVRYVAAQQIGEAACNKCQTCNKNCCCDEEMTKKLAEVAYERDDCGCWLESSERVREAARVAMQRCCAANRDQGGELVEPALQDGETVPPPPPGETVPPSAPSETVPPPPSADASALYEVDPSVLRAAEAEPAVAPESIRMGENELVLDFSPMKSAPRGRLAPRPAEETVATRPQPQPKAVDLKPRLTDMLRSYAKAPQTPPARSGAVQQTSTEMPAPVAKAPSPSKTSKATAPVVEAAPNIIPPMSGGFKTNRLLSPDSGARNVKPAKATDPATATIVALQSGFSTAGR